MLQNTGNRSYYFHFIVFCLVFWVKILLLGPSSFNSNSLWYTDQWVICMSSVGLCEYHGTTNHHCHQTSKYIFYRIFSYFRHNPVSMPPGNGDKVHWTLFWVVWCYSPKNCCIVVDEEEEEEEIIYFKMKQRLDECSIMKWKLFTKLKARANSN